jgi:ferrochelatase
MAPWKRSLLLNLIILPTRPPKTAEAYRAVWTERGSPLIAFSEDFAAALQERMPEAQVEIGMAYGAPSIKEAFEKLTEAQVNRILVVPMFPQYASATTGSVVQAAYEIAGHMYNVPPLSVLPPYYDDPGLLDAWKEVAKPALEAFKPDHVLMSYHGLPEFHVRKGDPTGSHCLCREDCCEVSVPANQYCYRHHCMMTTRGIIDRLELRPEQWSLSFQSRLGRDPWLRPYTDETLAKLGEKGVKRLAVLCPAFVADCLETLEEIGMQGKETFLEHGGEEYLLVPCLNSHPAWADACANLLKKI